MPFTPEELAEMALADAEIEATFQITLEDWATSRRLDRYAKDERLTNAERQAREKARARRTGAPTRHRTPEERARLSEYNRKYHAEHREEIHDRKRAYYQANKADYRRRNAEYKRRKRGAKHGKEPCHLLQPAAVAGEDPAGAGRDLRPGEGRENGSEENSMIENRATPETIAIREAMSSGLEALKYREHLSNKAIGAALGMSGQSVGRVIAGEPVQLTLDQALQLLVLSGVRVTRREVKHA